MCNFADRTNVLSHRRTSAVTVSVLKEYKEMITNTTSDLKDHLQEIDKKLETLALQGASMSDEDAAERQQIQEERDSTQQCLGICAQVFTHIDQVQSTTFESVSTDSATYQGSVTTLSGLPSARLTADALTQCKEKLTNTTTQLERRLQNINILLQKISSQPLESSSKQATELERIEEEKESIKQCLAICAQASREADQDRTNVFEDISMADDGHQVLVSTIGDLISAKRVSAGARSMQLLGQMSDDSVQQLSRNCGHIGTEKATEPQTVIATQFEYRHGGGVKGSRKTERSRGDAKIEREQRDRT
jgi:hypothetical protein